MCFVLFFHEKHNSVPYYLSKLQSQGEMEELTAEAEEATQVLDVLQQSLRNVETACQNSQLEEEYVNAFY